MSAACHILAIDQGTASTKSLLIDEDGRIVGTSADENYDIDASYPRPGWVEYDPEQILETICASAKAAVYNAELTWDDVAAVGLANHGETVIAFDADDGQPIYPAISWQDRRGEELIHAWREEGLDDLVRQETGLRLDAYFSASKLAWIVRNVPAAKKLLKKNRLRLGTSDSWLLWQLTGGRVFVTDVATASRTMLLNLKSLGWSDSLIDAFGLRRDCLPQIKANATRIGETVEDTFGFQLPITGLCVDQQAALFGHGCLHMGETKATYGTGCFLLSNIGKSPGSRATGLLSCVGWNIDGNLSYVFDGGVYSAGSLVQWLVELGLVGDMRELSHLAADVDDTNGVVMIPAFSGLAAPHWKGQARACWTGMSLGTDRRHLVRAALESIAYRVKDIVSSMKAADITIHRLHADGGLTRCEFLMQFQADVLGIPVVCANMPERTALGVGLMAGIGCMLWNGLSDLPHPSTDTKTYTPRVEFKGRYRQQYEKWRSICLEVATWD